MNSARFDAITTRYRQLRIAVLGDFCLDRYLEIDPTIQEVSIETGLPVHNVTAVRAQPGGAGTILNNLAALGIGEIHPVGFCGDDGEGYELRRTLAAQPGVCLDDFLQTNQRRTFTYCKPLVLEPGQPPRELNRLDSKNWTPTPTSLQDQLIAAITNLAGVMDAIIALDQVDLPETGVVTQRLRETLRELRKPLILADSRRGLRGFPPVTFKMNAAELSTLIAVPADSGLEQIKQAVLPLARENGHPVFVTLAERGIIGAAPDGTLEHVPALPVRGPIDIVGAGDAVTANLTAALAAGATLREALEIAMAAASAVIHQLGTTGTASVPQLQSLLIQTQTARQ